MRSTSETLNVDSSVQLNVDKLVTPDDFSDYSLVETALYFAERKASVRYGRELEFDLVTEGSMAVYEQLARLDSGFGSEQRFNARHFANKISMNDDPMIIGAYHNDVLIGYGFRYFSELIGNEIYIGDGMAVDPGFQKCGIATGIMYSSIIAAHQLGYSSFRIWAEEINSQGIFMADFYRSRFGFMDTGAPKPNVAQLEFELTDERIEDLIVQMT